MAMIRRKSAKRLALYALLAFLAYNLSKLILPLDSPVFLAVRWGRLCLHSLLHSTSEVDTLVLASPAGPYPVDFESRVGILIKTGYGTRERLPALLEVLGLGAWEPHRAVVVGDFSQRGAGGGGEGGEPVIRDAVGELMGYLTPWGLGDAERFVKYRSLRSAIEAADEERAQEIGRTVGWELDALKFIWGIGVLYKTTPPKDWYLILDDDTYPIPQTITALLSHLDPSAPHYLGNAVGDYRARFAHGGSAVLLSRGAVDLLYRQHPQATHDAHVNSLTETWGDRLLATTLQGIGVPLDERFSHLFNGEAPLDTRIWAARFCAPLVGFHELKRPEDMRAVGQRLALWEGPLVWSDVWGIFGGGEMGGFGARPAREGSDFVGRLREGEGKRTGGVGSAESCMRLCLKDRRRCLAWRWDTRTGECSTAPWMVVGREAEGVVSGINGEWAVELRERCNS